MLLETIEDLKQTVEQTSLPELDTKVMNAGQHRGDVFTSCMRTDGTRTEGSMKVVTVNSIDWFVSFNVLHDD